jgi:biopolymer transport protein ExbD
MRKRHLPEARSDHPNVVPLIDVIMCLIVFFMLIAKFGVDTGEDESVLIPRSILGSNIEDLGNTMVVNVANPPAGLDQPSVTALVQNALEPLRLIDPATGRSPLKETMLYRRYGADLKPGGERLNADNEEFKVILRGDQELDYRFLEPVLAAIADAGVASIAYQTEVVTETVPAPTTP